MNRILLSDAIIALGGSNCSVQDIDTIHWADDNPKNITKEQIQAKYDELVEADKKIQYQRDRKYPQLDEQLDMIYWDKKNGTKKWEESIDKVKADNPKPE